MRPSLRGERRFAPENRHQAGRLPPRLIPRNRSFEWMPGHPASSAPTGHCPPGTPNFHETRRAKPAGFKVLLRKTLDVQQGERRFAPENRHQAGRLPPRLIPRNRSFEWMPGHPASSAPTGHCPPGTPNFHETRRAKPAGFKVLLRKTLDVQQGERRFAPENRHQAGRLPPAYSS